MHRLALMIAASAVVASLQPSRALADWWKRAPSDYEECAQVAENATTKEEKSATLTTCNAKFAGRRKPGGGYVYYDFMQDRSFDIAGPNPTPEEQKYIDQQYTLYLEKQRRNNLEAAIQVNQPVVEPQAEQPQPLIAMPPARRVEPERVPIPQARPSKLIDGHPRCPGHEFSCEWPHLSDTIQDFKKLFGGGGGTKGKKS